MLYDRRGFIKRCIVLYGSVLLLPGCHDRERKLYRCFTQEEADCISAICEQIIPTDEYPGAIDANVMRYIDKQVYQRFPEEKQNYSEGVKAINSFCMDSYKNEFVNLSWETQNKILKLMEKNELNNDYWSKIEQRQFFNLIRRHTMQGYYGAPHHGGNKNYISYRMMNLDHPLLVGQNRYEK